MTKAIFQPTEKRVQKADFDTTIEGVLSGYGILYNVRYLCYDKKGAFWEEILTGAADEVVKTCDVRLLKNHNADLIFGRNTSGTMELKSDAKGVFYSSKLDMNNTDAANTYSSVKRGDISQCSFSFAVRPDGETWGIAEDGIRLRSISKLSVMGDIGPVTYPASPTTFVEARTTFSATEKRVWMHCEDVTLTDTEKSGLTELYKKSYDIFKACQNMIATFENEGAIGWLSYRMLNALDQCESIEYFLGETPVIEAATTEEKKEETIEVEQNSAKKEADEKRLATFKTLTTKTTI